MAQLTKGANTPLLVAGNTPHHVVVGVSWQAPTTSAAPFEVDLSILLCDAPSHLLGQDHVIFASQLQAPTEAPGNANSLDLTALDLGGASAPAPVTTARDTEEIEVDLTRVPPHINQIVFALAISSASARRQSIADLCSVVLRVSDLATGTEIASCPVDVTGQDATALALGEIYRRVEPDGTQRWKLRALGEGTTGGLAGLAAAYGVGG